MKTLTTAAAADAFCVLVEDSSGMQNKVGSGCVAMTKILRQRGARLCTAHAIPKLGIGPCFLLVAPNKVELIKGIRAYLGLEDGDKSDDLIAKIKPLSMQQIS